MNDELPYVAARQAVKILTAERGEPYAELCAMIARMAYTCTLTKQLTSLKVLIDFIEVMESEVQMLVTIRNQIYLPTIPAATMDRDTKTIVQAMFSDEI